MPAPDWNRAILDPPLLWLLSPLQVLFPVLQGEWVQYVGLADGATVAMSNYRLHVTFKDSVINVSVDPDLSRPGIAMPVPESLAEIFLLAIICSTTV